MDRAELRPEVIVAQHVIGLVNAKTRDEKVRDEAKKLLDADMLAQIEKTLDKRLGSGNEFKRANQFDKLLKEIDRNFRRAKEQDVRAWLSNVGVNPTTMNAPWPVCLIRGC